MTTCFRTLEGTVFNVSNSDIPCSDSNPTGCCVPGDFCLSNGICHDTDPTTGGSGYYLQSCTDSTFQSTIGQETLHCTTLDYPDITYNATTGLWACCGSDPTTGVQCSITTNETWAAPAPNALATIVSLQQAPPTSTSTSAITSPLSPSTPATPSPISLSSSAITPSPIPSTNSPAPVSAPTSLSSLIASPSTSPSFPTSSTSTSLNAAAAAASASSSAAAPSSSTHKTGLSSGADAGIGIGVVLGVIALVCLIFFATKSFRQRTHNRQSNAGLFGGPDPSAENVAAHHAFDHKPEGPGVADAGLGYGYQPQRFTGEPQFPQEILGGPSRYDAGGRPRHESGSGQWLAVG